MIRPLLVPLACAAALLPALAMAQPADGEPVTVVTGLAPITALVTPLAAGTGITVAPLLSRPAPMATLGGMLARTDPDREARVAAADAVVTIGSLWAGDPLYPALRADNIWVIEIDATNPLDATRPPIPRITAPVSNPAWRETTTTAAPGASHYPWLGPSAAIAMAEIVAHDLTRLSPDDADAIAANLATFRADMRRLKAEYDAEFAGLADFTVYALTDQFTYLTNEFGLFVDGYFLEQDVRWTEEDYSGLTAHLMDRGITTVIHQWEPSAEVAAAVEAAGAELVILSSGETMRGETDGAYMDMMRSNLDALYEALADASQ